MIFSQTEANKVIDVLFKHEIARLQKFIDDVINRHNEVKSASVNAISYNGEVYVRTGFYAPQDPSERPTVCDELWSRMENMILDQKKLSDDRSRIRQALCLAFSYSPTYQDARNTLPDFVWGMLNVQALPRTEPVGYCLQTKPLVHQQFLKNVELMNFYRSTALLY